MLNKKIDKRVEIKTAQISKKYESDMEKLATKLSEIVSSSFINQVAKKLNKGTIKQFSDASYSSTLKKLIRTQKAKLKKRIDNDKLKKAIEDIYQKANTYNKNILYSSIKTEIGLDLNNIIKSDGLQSFIKAKTLETLSYYQKHINDLEAQLETSILRNANAGSSFEKIIEELHELARQGDNKARFLARNEMGTFSGQITKKRGQKLGVKKAIWKASMDERTRPSHEDRHNKEFDIDNGCYSSIDGMYLNVGEDFNCRCTMTMVIDPAEMLGLSEDDIQEVENKL